MLFVSGCGGGADFSDQPPADEKNTDVPVNDPQDPSVGLAKQLYDGFCADCHGENGIGGIGGGNLYQCDICGDQAALFTTIRTQMPVQDPGACDDECSRRLTNLILSDFTDETGEGEAEAPTGAPVADASRSSGLAGVAPLAVNLNAGASHDNGMIVAWSWSLDSASTLSGEQVQYIWNEPGTYTVTLTVTDDEGLTDSDSIVVQVYAPLENAPPVAAVSASMATVVAMGTIEFDGGMSSDDQGIAAYGWDFGDGTTGTGREISHIFNSVGEHNVVLTVTDLGGLTDTASIRVTVTAPADNAAPVADFSMTPNGGEAPVDITFDAGESSDDSGIASYTWNFGDGTFGSGAQVNHRYTQPGTFSVRLTVTDSQGLSSFSNISLTIAAPAGNEPPVAVASLSAQQGLAPLSVRFSSADSSDDNGIAGIQWEFGDGQTSDQANPSHTYQQAGTYSGRLTVSDAGGLTDSQSFTVLVQSPTEAAAAIYQSQCASCHGPTGEGSQFYPALTIGKPLNELVASVAEMPPNVGVQCAGISNCETLLAQYILDTFVRSNAAPVADASASSNTSGNLPLVVRFDATRSSDDHGIVSWRWDFGDGVSGAGETVNHSYGNVGNYTASLTVTDEEGLASTDTVNVVVTRAQQNQAPVAEIQANPTAGEVPLPVSFSGANSSDDFAVTGYNWNFGDGTTGNGVQVNHTYGMPGVYTVTLTVVDAQGLQGTAQAVIHADAQINDAASLYQARCANCHGQYGQGGEGPALTDPVAREELVQDIFRMPPNDNLDCGNVNNCESALADYILENIVIQPGDGPFACNINSATQSPAIIRRLSQQQIINVYRDILTFLVGADAANQEISWREPRMGKDYSSSGFHHLDQSISDRHAMGLLDFALSVSEQIWFRSEVVSKLTGGVSCQLNQESCRRAVMQNGAELIFRRPATQEEIDHYTGISNPKLFIASLFMSPAFLYHAEYNGSVNSDPNGGVNLTPYEIASRLSFLFWNTGPDQALLNAAAAGTIETNYESVLANVMNDPRTRKNISRFYEGWLRLEETQYLNLYNETGYDTTFMGTDYAGAGDTRLPKPNWDSDPDSTLEAYRNYAIKEIRDMTDYYTYNNGSLTDLFTSPHSFAQGYLAKAYGVGIWNPTNGNPDTAAKVLLPEGERSGILTRAAMLMSNGLKTRPIVKGVHIRKDILCDDIPPPDDNASPPGAVIEEDFTSREITEALTEIQGTSCRGCHVERINPLGFATEQYDSIGRFRGVELILSNFGELRYSPPVDASTDVDIDGLPQFVNGGVELSELIASSPKVDACFARKLFRFTFARMEDLQLDGCLLNTLAQTADQQSLLDVFRQIALHPDFRRRTLNRNQ